MFFKRKQETVTIESLLGIDLSGVEFTEDDDSYVIQEVSLFGLSELIDNMERNIYDD